MLVIETLAVAIALAQPARQTPIKGGRIGEFVQQDGVTWTSESFSELDALLSAELPSTLRPTYYSYSNARKRLIEMSALLSVKPEIALDGEGGIDIEWEMNGRELMYACRANPNQCDYIYFQAGSVYGGNDYSAIYSTDRLNWFLKG